MNSKKEKAEFLRGLMTGERNLNELHPDHDAVLWATKTDLPDGTQIVECGNKVYTPEQWEAFISVRNTRKDMVNAIIWHEQKTYE